MTHRITILLLLCVCIPATLGAQEITSVRQFSANGSEFGNRLHVDSEDNYYLTGYFSGSLRFSSTTLNGAGAGDVFFVKYNRNGALQWARTGTSNGWNGGRGIAVDPDGNAFVAGRIQETATFDNLSVTSAGQNDPFVAKYTSDGTVQWVRSGRGAGDDWAQDVAAGPEGNSYVTGMFTGSLSFDGESVSSSGAEDAFLVAYSPDGDVIWAESMGGSGQDYGYGVATDAVGNVYVVGEFLGSMKVGGVTLSGGGRSGFIASWTSDGEFRWADAIGGSLMAEKTTVNAAGEIYVVGAFSSSLTVGEIPISSSGGEDIYVVRYDTTGQVDAAWAYGGSGKDGVAGFGQSSQVAATSDGGFVLVSSFEQTVRIGETTLTSAGKTDVLVARFDHSGAPLWAVSGGGTESESFLSTAVNSNDNALVFGNFFSSTFSFGPATLVRSGFADMFLATIVTKGEAKPTASVTPSSVDFGNVATGSPALRKVVVRPATSAELIVTTVDFDDPGKAGEDGFRIVSPAAGTLPKTLAPGERLEVEVEFAASELGAQTATLQIGTNDAGTPLHEVSLAARGVEPGVEPVARFSSMTVDFGTVWVGQGADAALRVEPGSTVPLEIIEVEFAESDAFDLGFEITSPLSGDLPVEIPPGDSLRIGLTFTALSNTEENVTLRVRTNDPVNPITDIPVTARGAHAPIAELSDFSLAFGDVEVGGSSGGSLTIGAGNETPVQIEALEIVGTDGPGTFEIIAPDDLSSLPISINGGEELTVTITCMPDEEGVITARLRIVTNDPTLPEGLVDLSARGVITNSVEGESGETRNRLQVEPNPMLRNGRITINRRIGGPAEVRILDILGRTILTIHEGYLPVGESSFSVDPASLPAGTYITEVTCNGERFHYVFTVR